MRSETERYVVAGRRAALLLVLMTAAAVISCEDDNGSGRAPTPTGSPAMTSTLPAATSTATPTRDQGAQSTRDVDFSMVPAIAERLSSGCVEWSPCSIGPILYHDLTLDGRDEAVIPIHGLSGMGRQPVLAVFVFGYVDATLRQLLFVEDNSFAPEGGFNGPLWLYVADGALAIGDTFYKPGEPLCCASETLLSIYRWDGTALTFESSEAVACGDVHPMFGEIVCPRY